MTKTAILIQIVDTSDYESPDEFKPEERDIRVYQLTPPHEGHPFVRISAVKNRYIHETHIFPCDYNGVVECWTEMAGSLKGEMNHERALGLAGYTLDLSMQHLVDAVRKATGA